MAKLKVTVHRDENLFPRLIEIQKGKKTKLKIKQTPSSLGDAYTLEIEGRKDALPSFPELFSIVNAKRLDRIGTIELIDVVDLIKEITTIGNVGNLSELTTIRDVSWMPKSIIQNPSFEQDFTGWHVHLPDYIKIDATQYKWMLKSCRFDKTIFTPSLYQTFPIPFNTDWFTKIDVWVRTTDTANALSGRLMYTDGNYKSTALTCATANTWYRKTLSKDANKYVEVLWFIKPSGDFNSGSMWIDDIYVVFA